MANFKSRSRYDNGTVTFSRDNTQFLVLRSALDLSSDNTDTYVTINQDLQKRPDLISYKAYGTVDLWWVIYEYNKIRDPFFDIQIGQTLKIPALDRVLEAVARINT